jgi:hypothetical protein
MEIGCFRFEEQCHLHMTFTQAAHNRWKPVGVTLGDRGSGGGCQKQSDEERKNNRYQRSVEGLRSSSKVHASRGC